MARDNAICFFKTSQSGSLTIKVVVTVVATIVFPIMGAIGVKKSDPLTIVIAVFIVIPTVLFGFPVCLQALAVLIGQ
ncbi:TPA: hypothetical protein QDE50_35490 [Burkholderia cenocepacia]|nr:hypothetical protein [Burkholderia cenocepacia]HDR9889652.1 hypothetical protein [Burkholderia cenocepacia]